MKGEGGTRSAGAARSLTRAYGCRELWTYRVFALGEHTHSDAQLVDGAHATAQVDGRDLSEVHGYNPARTATLRGEIEYAACTHMVETPAVIPMKMRPIAM